MALSWIRNRKQLHDSQRRLAQRIIECDEYTMMNPDDSAQDDMANWGLDLAHTILTEKEIAQIRMIIRSREGGY